MREDFECDNEYNSSGIWTPIENAFTSSTIASVLKTALK